MRAKVTTMIDGLRIVHTGRFCKKTDTVTDSKGMKLVITKGDIVEFIEPKKRQKAEVRECCLDMHQWFKKSKQI